ncbi:MAG: MotA/TolQ/ExbB proton channel family protein [Planctomycetota bacterium]|nr:MotA/TolQ/ExbB proton channel family protein [Planctomycetota bacterium]MDA1248140.1 MotA/TolQ/ExbB proton channel family protein [Planctomycetota bacterium]
MTNQQTSRADFNGRGWKCSPLLWGSVLSVAFYSLLPFVVAGGSPMDELFCGHPLAYTATCLFWAGIAGLAVKLLRLPSQKKAFNNSFEAAEGFAAEESAVRLQSQIASLPAPQRQTWAVSRLADLCSFVKSRKSTSGLNSHLEYLAEFAGEQMHHSYAFVRTVTWAVPIIGFLGTVVGITQAIKHLDPQKLTQSFDLVANGLSVAFGTTALALGLSLVLVFGAYLVEKLERSTLAEIEMLAVSWMTELFPAAGGSGSTLAEAEAQAAAQLLEQTEVMIRRQTENWEHAVEQLRSRWVDSFEQHQIELASSLRSGVDATLDNHGRQLAEAREVLIEGVRETGEQTARSLQLAHETHEQRSQEIVDQNSGMLAAVRSELSAAREEQHTQLRILSGSFERHSTEWESRLENWATSIATQVEAQQQLAAAWSKLAGGQEQLVSVEKTLAENLQVAQAADSLNETLHSLNAAVHILTARVRPAA